MNGGEWQKTVVSMIPPPPVLYDFYLKIRLLIISRSFNIQINIQTDADYRRLVTNGCRYNLGLISHCELDSRNPYGMRQIWL